MMYLLDTHGFIWYCEGSKRLSNQAKAIINDPNNRIYLSIASLWEFSIKYSLQKLKFEGGLLRMGEIISQYDFILLPIREAYLLQVVGLPFIHRDPFDRMLVATAKAEGMTILTADDNIPKYDVPTLW